MIMLRGTQLCGRPAALRRPKWRASTSSAVRPIGIRPVRVASRVPTFTFTQHDAASAGRPLTLPARAAVIDTIRRSPLMLDLKPDHPGLGTLESLVSSPSDTFLHCFTHQAHQSCNHVLFFCTQAQGQRA